MTLEDVRNGTHLIDDFVSNDSVADAGVGALNWELETIANAPTLSFLTGETNGVLRHTTAAVASGDGGVMRLFTDGIALSGNEGFLRARVRYPNVAGNQLASHNFHIGLNDSITATDPVVGIGIQSLAGVVSLRTDSANGDKITAAGFTMVLGTWHTFEMRWSGENANGGPDIVKLWIDDVFRCQTRSHLGSAETMEPKITHWQAAGLVDLELDIDYFELFISR